MSVDLAKLPADEERVRQYALYSAVAAREIQNVLDALNHYRCLARHLEHGLTRAKTSKAEAWAAVHVRDAEINVTVKRLRTELDELRIERQS